MEEVRVNDVSSNSQATFSTIFNYDELEATESINIAIYQSLNVSVVRRSYFLLVQQAVQTTSVYNSEQLRVRYTLATQSNLSIDNLSSSQVSAARS